MRSFGTESTLTESIDDIEGNQSIISDRTTGTIPEDAEEEEEPTTRRKRFSATKDVQNTQDGMGAVDAGITEKSEKIAQKVMEIQQKVCLNGLLTLPSVSHENVPQLESALATDRVTKWKEETSFTQSEDEVETRYTRRPPRPRRSRNRSGTASSTATNTTAFASDETRPRRSLLAKAPSGDAGNITPTLSDDDGSGQSTPEPRPPKSTSSHSKSRRVLTPGINTDESDGDFQSAYSASPSDSHGNADNTEDHDEGDTPRRRRRATLRA